ncbi:MAG: HAMP domain-containing protein [Ignavibacteriales bacterium]|nr:HAMP domain-containing protein [Ignavibacteriales bacterium]
MSIDLLDAKGTPVAWQGRNATDDYSKLLNRDSDTVVALTTAGLRTFLAVSLPARSVGITVVLSEPFEVNLPISNRFVREASFHQSLEQKLGVEIQLLYGEKTAVRNDNRNLRVQLIGGGKTPVATAILPSPTLERELERYDLLIRNWLNGVLALSALGIAFPAAMRLRKNKKPVVRLFGLLGCIWGVRYVWIGLDFPAEQIGGFLFDPTLYASPFGAGLATSLGETFLSALALLFSVLGSSELTSAAQKKLPGNRKTGQAVALGILLAACAMLMLIFRSYGAALRSFVYDSTLQFVEPSDVLPSAEVSVMYGVIIVMTVSLLILVALIIGVVWTRLQRSFPEVRSGILWLLFVLVYSLVAVVFMEVNRVPQFPWYGPFLLFASAMGIFLWSDSPGSLVTNVFGRLSGVGTLIVLSFILSVSLLDDKIHEKEEDRLRLYAHQLIRPVDAWLSFVVTESFRTVVQESEQTTGGAELQRGMKVAFPIWAKTLISREGYNSALVLYDNSGYEIDRFTVGLTGYEQTELLRRLFDVNEEDLNVVERRVAEGLIKYYGMWGTIRDVEDRLLGIAALLLGASEQALFRGEAPEPLRPFGVGLVGRSYQSVFLSEYQDGRLITSNDLKRQGHAFLPEAVAPAFSAQPGDLLQQGEIIDGAEYETLYVRDSSRPGRVIAVSLEEVGLRWHIFNLVKVAVLYLFVLTFVALVFLVVHWREYHSAITGFRGKLIVAFLVVAIVPLVLLGYYNRKFAEEREELNIAKRLRQDLELVHQRIMNSLFDVEDFSNGITNDFCEAAAAEFGVDFTVFQRALVQSSSRYELYQSAILDSRLPGGVFARLVVAGQGYVQTRESIGDVTYAVGYKPIVFNDRTLGVVAVPALYRQSELEAEVAERNAFTLGVYGMLLLMTVIAGVVLASQLSQPVRDLTRAARQVGEGKLDVRVRAESTGELQDLILTFNEMAAELERSRDELRKIERELAWKEMAKQVAHEIKNPLTPMRLSVQHLRQAFKDRTSDLEAIMARVTGTLMEQIDSLARIATEFSSFARMPERKFERVDLHQLLKEALQLFNEVEGIELQVNFSDTPALMVADRDEVRRVFINIIRNAVQAMERGGRVSVETRVAENRCRIRIQDTGVGIPPHLQKKVFQPNFSTKSDGMGLGLALAKKAVVDLDGEIKLRSEEGRGTTIEIELPLMRHT